MVEGWSVGPGRAAPPTGDVEFALADAPAGRLFALLTAAVLLAGAPTAALRLPPLAGALLLLAGVAVGAGLARLATARTATLRVDPRGLVLSAPALRAPLVVPRAAVRAVVVDPVAARERRAGGASAWVAARGAEHLASRTGDPEQPWWPVDLAPHLPLGDATVTGPAAVPNVAVVLHAPVALPTTWPAWLLSRLTGSLTEPVARPGKVVGGVLLRAADPLAVAAALGDAAPTGPLDSPTVAAFAPRRTGVRRRAIAVGVAAAVVVGGVGGQGFDALRGGGTCDTTAALVATGRAQPGFRASAAVARLDTLLPSADGVAEFAGTAPVQRGLTVDDAAAAHGDTARARAAMDTLGWSGGERREWYRGATTWMAVQVEQLAGEAEAFDYDLFALLDACHDAAAAYAVPGLADAVGLRLRRPGGVVERVSFVRGARRYTVEVAGAQQPDAATVTALAVAAASVAR